MSREVWFLRQVENQKYSDDFVQNITQLNKTMSSVSKYLISMQKGIDDLNRDIFEVIGDFVDELVILFTGGTGMDFGLDSLIPAIQPLLATVPILGDLMEILSGIEDGDVNDVGTWVNNLLNNLGGLGRNTNRILLELQAKLSEGATFSDTFDRGDNVVLGNGWVQGGNGSELQIMGNAARINGPASYGAGRRYAICPKKADDNDMAVSVGVNNKGISPAVCTTLILQSNDNMTEFVYANLFQRRFYIGRGTRTGNNWSFNDWKSSVDQKWLTEGGLVEFTVEGDYYKLTCNGETLLDHTDTSSYPRDENHRRSGFAEQTDIIFLIPHFSWGVVAYTLRSQVKFTAVETAVNKATAAVEKADALIETVSGVADTVNQLVGEKEGESSNGAYFYYNFKSMPKGDTLTMFNHQVPGRIGVRPSGLAGPLSTSGAVEGRIWTMDKLTADDQQVSVVLGEPNVLDTYTDLLLRVSPNGTLGVLMRIGTDYAAIAKFTATLSGSYTSFEQLGATINIGQAGGDTFAFRAVGENYTALKNNNIIGIRTNTGTPVAKGEDYRRAGLNFKQQAGLFTFAPAMPSSMAISDFATPLYRGTGFRVFRSSGTSAGASATGVFAALPNGCFDVLAASPNMEVVDLGRGEIKILKAGWYSFTMRLNMSANLGSSLAAPHLFRKNNSGVTEVTEKGPDYTGNVFAMQATFAAVYCNVGDVMSPGYYMGSSRNFTGNSDGGTMYFGGTLVSG